MRTHQVDLDYRAPESEVVVATVRRSAPSREDRVIDGRRGGLDALELELEAGGCSPRRV